MIPPDHFHQFIDFDPAHRGVTVVIWGSNLTENDVLGYPIVGSLYRCLNVINRLCTQDRIPADHFHRFTDFDPTYRGVTGVIWGSNPTENDVD